MLTLIGDVHGKVDRYLEIIENCKYSLQLGDLGFDYSRLQNIDSSCHKMIFGNHDWYPHFDNFEMNLGNFGLWMDIFYVRGAWSIDQKFRTIGISWWPEEELSPEQVQDAIGCYKFYKPKKVVTHSCPFSILPNLGLDPIFAHSMGFNTNIIPTRTNQMLDIMWNFHQPDIWVFGHFHRSFDQKIGNTRFICLNELETFILE